MEDNVFNINSKALSIAFSGPFLQQVLKVDFVAHFNWHPDVQGNRVIFVPAASKVRVPVSLQACLSPHLPQQDEKL